MTKNWLVLFGITFVMVCGLLTPQAAMANPKYASIVIDADTGMILRERYADKKLHPASLTKMMTLYMVFDAIESGELSPNQRIWISPHAASMVPSKLGLKPGSTIRVEDAIYSLVTKSANDVAAALGEAVSGSESQFAIDMTRRARDLGMSNTVFRNASGLHDPRQVSTARDMARLSQALIHGYPDYYRYFSTNNFKYRGKSYHNHNGLLKSYTGMDGIKTGYISAAGFNLAASAKRGQKRLIGIVFGGRSSSSRNAHMAQIMDEGFAKVKRITYATASAAPLPSPKPEALGYASLQGAQKTRVAQVSSGSIGGNGFEMMGLVVGEGDSDNEATRQVLASMHSMSQTNGGLRKVASATQKSAVAKAQSKSWSVQIGAYESHESSSKALRTAAQKLPPNYVRNVKPQIVTATSKTGTIYRARFSGLKRDVAVESCRILKNCIVLASQ
ncbi:MAG: serine hydrolase [Pseudomonadota bacterium]